MLTGLAGCNFALERRSTEKIELAVIVVFGTTRHVAVVGFAIDQRIDEASQSRVGGRTRRPLVGA